MFILDLQCYYNFSTPRILYESQTKVFTNDFWIEVNKGYDKATLRVFLVVQLKILFFTKLLSTSGMIVLQFSLHRRLSA